MVNRISKAEATQQIHSMIEELGYLPVLEIVADWIDEKHPFDGMSARVAYRLRRMGDAGTLPSLTPEPERTCRKCAEIRRDDGTLYSTGDMGQ